MSELERLLQKGEVLFYVSDGRKFVRWAKKEGCALDGAKRIGVLFKSPFYAAVGADKKISTISAQECCSRERDGNKIFRFEEFLKGEFITPNGVIKNPQTERFYFEFTNGDDSKVIAEYPEKDEAFKFAEILQAKFKENVQSGIITCFSISTERGAPMRKIYRTWNV